MSKAEDVYYSGTPCKKCQSTKRYISNGKCVACTQKRSQEDHYAKAEKRRAYMQEYYYRRKNSGNPTYELKGQTGLNTWETNLAPSCGYQKVSRERRKYKNLPSPIMVRALELLEGAPFDFRRYADIVLSDTESKTRKHWAAKAAIQRYREAGLIEVCGISEPQYPACPGPKPTEYHVVVDWRWKIGKTHGSRVKLAVVTEETMRLSKAHLTIKTS